MKLVISLGLVLLGSFLIAQSQNTLAEPIDSPLNSTPLNFDSSFVIKKLEIRDCIHSHLCCQIQCPCCPEGQGFYPTYIQPEPLKRKKTRKKAKA